MRVENLLARHVMEKNGTSSPTLLILKGDLTTSVTHEIKVKSPEKEKWKKIKAVFDTEAPEEQVRKSLAEELGIEAEIGDKIFIHIDILGEILSWPFRVVQELPASLLVGQEFIQINGIMVNSRNRKVRFAPGYPQSPVI